MARWKLATAHYIMTLDGCEWEYKEVDRKSGRMVRKNYPVPRYLDPNDPGDWTTKWGAQGQEDGEVIVCQGEGNGQDIHFLGDPTPDMIPVDDEAKAISAGFAEQWKYKPDVMPGDYSQSLIDQFQIQMADAQARPAQVEGLADLVAAISAMATSNKEVVETLRRRV